MKRSKGVTDFILSDPLRAKYWINGCPNCDMDDMLGFIHKTSSLSKIKEVKCYGCYSTFTS